MDADDQATPSTPNGAGTKTRAARPKASPMKRKTDDAIDNGVEELPTPKKRAKITKGDVAPASVEGIEEDGL